MSYYLIDAGFSTDPNTFVDAGIGTFDAVNRIAVLTVDISQSIIILIDNVTLKGLKIDNTSPIISYTGGDGINISSIKGVTITNFEIVGNNNGIYAENVTNVIISGNSIHDNTIGIKFEANNNSNKIENNSIFNNTTGIDFNTNNSANVIENNCIYDNYEYGINFFENNNSNIINNNKITNDGHGIYLALFNNSNTFQCNDISCNQSSNTGVYIDGDNNSITQNNFIENCTHAISNGNNNSFYGNYWYPPMDCIPYSSCNVIDCHPSRCRVHCGKRSFKQFSMEECMTIPEQKPCAAEILECLAEIKITNVSIVKTAKGCSNEGQILTGHKAVITGNLLQKVQYIADEPTQGVHSAHFTNPFCSYIVLDRNYKKGTQLHINASVEDISTELLDKRHIVKNVFIYLEAKDICS